MQGYIGEVRLWASYFPPLGWSFCEGQILSIADHDVLYAVIGSTYGGDGITTFALPDLRGRVPIGAGSGTGLTARDVGDQGGTPEVTLSEGQMPAHTHAVVVQPGAGDSSDPQNGYLAAGDDDGFGPAHDAQMAADAVGSAGGSAGETEAHENMQPYLALRYIICIQGQWPARAD